MPSRDWKKFPELTNQEMETLYWESPHKQIFEDFKAKVYKVHDGDTITLETDFRKFRFPLRIVRINAPELNERGGKASRDWLKDLILKQEVDVLINPKDRVEKWGRLLGDVIFKGMTISEASMMEQQSVPFEDSNVDKLPELNLQIQSLEKQLEEFEVTSEWF